MLERVVESQNSSAVVVLQYYATVATERAGYVLYRPLVAFAFNFFCIEITMCAYRLLDILAGRKDKSGLTGQVLVNGQPQPRNFKCISGYVVQVSDHVYISCTARTTIIFRSFAVLTYSSSVATRPRYIRIINIIVPCKIFMAMSRTS